MKKFSCKVVLKLIIIYDGINLNYILGRSPLLKQSVNIVINTAISKIMIVNF